MTRLHKLGTYRDGYKSVEYCKVCSAEGEKLAELCPGNFPDPDKKDIDVSKAPTINNNH